MIQSLLRPALLLAPLVLALPAASDTIYLVDGSSLTDVDVIAERLDGVTYKVKGKSGEQRLDPDSVLLIDYRRLPKLIDEAETLVDDGAVNDGVDLLMRFAQEVFDGQNRRDRQAWAPAHALERVVELRLSLGDWEGVVAAADLLAQKVPESRHVPRALLAKAQAQQRQGKGAQAQATIQALLDMIAAKGLSQRWSLECELAQIAADERLAGQAKRDRLSEVAAKAGKKYPTVRNRARVAEGETYIEGSKQDFASARSIFEGIAADPKADDPTLAAAFTGLGDCLFHAAAEKIKAGTDATKELQEALMAYMRVVVRYKDQSAYVPKAMFYAGRVFDFLGDDTSKSNARRLYTAVIQGYRDTPWAAEARSFRK